MAEESQFPPPSTRRPPPDAGDREPVEVLAAEFVELHRSGECPQIEDYTRAHPDLADEILDLFPTIAKLENLRLAKDHSSDDRAVVGVPRFTKLGGFRIIRELGRGGMGVVYEAEDNSLKRRVALKVLGANIAHSATQMQRFRHEAEAAARLYHPHIVAVFGTGEEHGVMFYVMQLIDGIPLSELIEQLRADRCRTAGGAPAGSFAASGLFQNYLPVGRRQGDKETRREGDKEKTPGDGLSACLPLPPSPELSRRWRDWATTARTTCDLADALAYAHAQGVLHRDIKPANVLVDREGCVWIGDFGLAKHEDHQAVTNTGDLVGTLRYMAPEQFQGQADSRSDVYSLGLTFYELLTLQPAFPETQHAPLIFQKTTTPVPSPQSIEAAIPRDLETIALKACALEPAHRYQSAAEFADDLRCFIEDRPIRARRTSEFERLWRWSRRNPLIAGLGGLALVLLAAVAVVFAVGNHRTNVALKSAVDAAQTAHDERLRAEGNLQLAVKALDEIMQNVSERGIPQTLQIGINGTESPLQNVMVTEADAALLKSLLHFFDEFASDNRAILNAQTATALQRIGAIQQRLGSLEAESAFEQSVDIYRKLIAANPGDRQLRFDLAGTWNQIGTVRSQKGSLPDAIEAHVAALDALRSSAAVAASVAGKFRLAETYTLIGTVGSRVGGGEIAARPGGPPELGPSREGRGPIRGSRRDEPSRGGPRGRGDHLEPDAPEDPSRHGGRPDIGPEFWREEDGPPPPPLFDRDEAIGQAVSLLKELLGHDPQNPDYQFALAKAFRAEIHGRPRERQGHEATDARRAAADAVQILRGLVSRFPSSSIYTYELAATLSRAAQRVPDLEPGDRAMRVQEAQELATRLVSAHSQAPEYQALLANAERRLGAFAHRRQEPAEAADRYRRALDLYGRLYERFPSVSLYQVGFAQTLSEWAEVLRDSGQRDDAANTLDRAVGIAERCAAAWPRDPMFRDFLADLRRQQRDLKAE